MEDLRARLLRQWKRYQYRELEVDQYQFR